MKQPTCIKMRCMQYAKNFLCNECTVAIVKAHRLHLIYKETVHRSHGNAKLKKLYIRT